MYHQIRYKFRCHEFCMTTKFTNDDACEQMQSIFGHTIYHVCVCVFGFSEIIGQFPDAFKK